MRLNSRWLAVLLLFTVIPLSGCGFLQKLRARDNLNKGVKAFTEQKYSAAAQFFQKSLQMDPEFETARMYLATSYTSMFVPGSTDPESEENAHKAIDTFKEVVAMAEDPANPNRNAMLSIASLYYQLKDYPQSKEWCNRVLKVDPQNAEAYYRIAVIDFDDSFERTGIQGENVAYMSPEEKAETLANVDEALTCLTKALEIRPDYFDAMEYQNLLWREKAKFEEDEAVKAELIREADKVSLKALELRLKAQEEAAKKPRKLAIGN
jgi:tetratricopeptide (TPR) repeat protein